MPFEIPNPLIKRFQEHQKLLVELRVQLDEAKDQTYVLTSQYDRLISVLISALQIFIDTLISDDKIKIKMNEEELIRKTLEFEDLKDFGDLTTTATTTEKDPIQ